MPSGRDRALDLRLVAVGDLDPARLHRLRHFAHQVDRQYAVGQVGADDLDVVRQAEMPPERTAGDALVEIFAIAGRLGLLAGHDQLVWLGRDRQLVRRKARDGERDPVGVFSGLLDVVGRVVVGLLELHGVVEHIEQPVEADGRPAEWRKVYHSHNHILLEQYGYEHTLSIYCRTYMNSIRQTAI